MIIPTRSMQHHPPSTRPRPRGGLAALALALCCLLSYQTAVAFSFNDVALRAKELAGTTYKKRASNLPNELQAITYDQYRDIRFKPEKYAWRNSGLPFELGFFHQGYDYDRPVKIHEIDGTHVHEFRFDPALFDYGTNKFDLAKFDPTKLHGLGFAGFRVHYPLNTPKYKDEVLVFLGASYFRALGKNQLYGISARGLAVDTAVSSGEEFPSFVEFWIERPGANAEELKLYALLDSPRVTGAYRFLLHPGTDTAIDVKARLFLRGPVGKLGLAPLTSMFLFGENQRAERDDFRPEVHDSDGLSVHLANGE